MKKRGFALIAAIFFIIIVGTIAVTTLATANMTARDTVNLYVKEQAVLLAQSATEFAVMAMQSHQYNDTGGNNCLEQINMTYPTANDPLYTIRVDIYYLDNTLGCNTNIGTTALSGGTRTHSALVDVTVSSSPNDVPRIVYNRRTLQKP
ncbi:MAG: hypothetical protein J6W17_03455 [Campylobacter sp.]|nr:hypothetical protein [Campylobacter sp.]